MISLHFLFLFSVEQSGSKTTSPISIVLPVVITVIILAISIVIVAIMIMLWKRKKQGPRDSPDRIYDVVCFTKGGSPITECGDKEASIKYMQDVQYELSSNAAYAQ